MLAGVGFTIAGLVLWASMRLPVVRSIGRLPGDLLIHRGTITVFFPVASSIILSILLTVVLNLLIRR
ncbi:MAG: DUF2905 domain-containing protein [Thermomicrobiales bacterium]